MHGTDNPKGNSLPNGGILKPNTFKITRGAVAIPTVPGPAWIQVISFTSTPWRMQTIAQCAWKHINSFWASRTLFTLRNPFKPKVKQPFTTRKHKKTPPSTISHHFFLHYTSSYLPWCLWWCHYLPWYWTDATSWQSCCMSKKLDMALYQVADAIINILHCLINFDPLCMSSAKFCSPFPLQSVDRDQ